MKLPENDLLAPVGGGLAWISGEGPHADIVLSTRIRLARNLERFPFREAITGEQQERVEAKGESRLRAERHDQRPARKLPREGS